MPNHEEARQKLRARIAGTRGRIRRYREQAEPRAVRLTTANIIAASLAGVLTAGPAIGGTTLTDALGSAGSASPSWRVLCALATVSSFVAAVAAALYRQHELAPRLARAQATDARLEGLESSLDGGRISVSNAAQVLEECLHDVAFIPSARPQARRGLLDRLRSSERALAQVRGEIDAPAAGGTVQRVVRCSGRVQGLEPGVSLWLVVETGPLLWPKAGQIVFDDGGAWSATVFEDGAVERFSLSLYATGRAADREIRRWLHNGQRAGAYRQMTGINGAHRRITRVDGLRLQPAESGVLEPAAGDRIANAIEGTTAPRG